MKLQWTRADLLDLEVWVKTDNDKVHRRIYLPFMIDLASKKVEYITVTVPKIEETTVVDPTNPPALTEEVEIDTKAAVLFGDIIICEPNKTVVAATDKTLLNS